jgi:erythromycin esterase-like protein
MSPAMPEPSSADRNIVAVADRLKELKSGLGAAYWRNDEVRELQERLRKQIGAYGAWSEDKLPMHQRARRAARYESEFAALLWPGRDADA